MPGILPMKVIKIGTSSQTRIAQACDRCRSKKIRCDGVRPCCTQCSNVGFECKTSDKLSRRAFPRGYTESLEERVRSLETEVKELKDLLDAREEQIEILSKIHSYLPHSTQRSSASPESTRSKSEEREPKESESGRESDDEFIVHEPSLPGSDDQPDAIVMGSSSGKPFLDAFKVKAQETGKHAVGVNMGVFFNKTVAESVSPARSPASVSTGLPAPPRMLSDQLVNIFFQEWAPLFPILHRPSFLTMYEKFVAGDASEVVRSKQTIAQLYLVFSIAASSLDTRTMSEQSSFEKQWQQALDAVLLESKVETLQCLLLAQIYCITRGDYTRLLHYKSLAVGLCQRLSLHQSQKSSSLGALTTETRKKTFWCLYTIDCFSAAMLGLPKLLRESDIHVEYPADIDDEYVTENGFQPTLPGDLTKVSTALALFQAARVLSHVLDSIYPSAASHKVSLSKMEDLEDELDIWSSGLASHLKLEFVQDKPATNVVNSRSPLLSLAHHYIRVLIHRPAAASNLGSKASASIIALGESSKRIVQIAELLEERKLSFSFCLNKPHLLLLSGFGLLFSSMSFNQDGVLVKDNQRLVKSVAEMLERGQEPMAVHFRRIAASVLVKKSPQPSPPAVPVNNDSSTKFDKAIQRRISSLTKRLSFSPESKEARNLQKSRRATAPAFADQPFGHFPNKSHVSVSSIRSEPPTQYQRYNQPSQKQRRTITTLGSPSLDFLPSTLDPIDPFPPSTSNGGGVSAEEWERLLGSIDNGQTNIYDNIYGGPPVEILNGCSTPSAGSKTQSWSIDSWGLLPNDLGGPQAPQSVSSFSDESLTSGEDLSSVDTVRNGSGSFGNGYDGILMPNLAELTGEEFGDLGF